VQKIIACKKIAQLGCTCMEILDMGLVVASICLIFMLRCGGMTRVTVPNPVVSHPLVEA
jgi:hypothetical protein